MQRAVFITGADTGIGEATALYLDQNDYRVIAGVLSEQQAVKLRAKASANLTTLVLDITDPNSIQTAQTKLTELLDEQGLFALYNNAGIALGAPFEFIPLPYLRKIFEV